MEKVGNGGLVQYAYNALNLLEQWTDGENTETYTYNAAGLLSTVNTNNSTKSLTWDILYGDGVVISEKTNDTVTDYTYGLERISASTGKARTEYVYDARGSVIGEVSKSGIFSAAQVSTKAYTPFGELIGGATSGFGWNGEYYNAVTGQVYLRARFYEPEMNRFSQKDILRGSVIDGASMNRYLYCQNDPVNYVDINGREAIVISGGDYKDKGENPESENLNSYNFIITALNELETIQAQSIDETVTWIISDSGWTSEDHSNFEKAVDTSRVNIVYIKNTSELTEYINLGSGIVNREDEKISYMSVLSHGKPRNIVFGYNYLDVNSFNYSQSDLTLSVSEVEKWDREAFGTASPEVETPVIKLYSCRGANGGENSIGNAIAASTGATVYAYQGKSSYKGIVSERSFLQKVSDKFTKEVYPEADAIWNSMKSGTMVASNNMPTAGNGANAVQISPTGQRTTITKIPAALDSPTPKPNIISKAISTVSKVTTAISNTYNSFKNTMKGWLGI